MEGFNGNQRDELLNRELFLSLHEARWIVDRRRFGYNYRQPHSALDYQTPAAFEETEALNFGIYAQDNTLC